ncbi:uncharacterized protein DSM5745_09330 [Aspergillus mulundensis]|uniref:Uncharacterized protein n=1 Tax=Aspergillus mulundensis TaxID=1810919 RepID=A0A3D8R0V5_9EURO|nr:hypothetical protein DSM5745_09330 [Aspergillus mulundensis]RDW67464.1 hypothetical protein DSM5745_09330 [Aspergillus mulundensis]
MPFCASSNPRGLCSSSSVPLTLDVNIGLVVDDVLDPAVLLEKWTQLIRSSPVMGGLLESKTETRRLIRGSLVDFDSRILNDTLNSILPFSWHGQSRPSTLHENVSDIDDKFLFNPTYNPKPVCLLRATILNDATILCFSFVHSLFDGQSCFDIIHFFCDLLSDKPIPKLALSPDMTGIRMSELIRETTISDEEPRMPREDVFITSRLGQLKLYAKALVETTVELFTRSEKLTQRLIHLPGAWVDEVRASAQKELDMDDEYPGVRLTRNDIIAALYLKMVYSSTKPSNNPVDFYGPLNYRSLLGLSDETHYTHNSIITLRCPFSEREIQDASIAQIAEKIRLATMQYKHPAVVKNELRANEDRVLAPAIVKVRGSIQRSVPYITPWTTFQYADLDFSGASARKTGRNASVVFVNPQFRLLNGQEQPTLFLTTLKDCSGGYWLRGSNTASGWEAFETLF